MWVEGGDIRHGRSKEGNGPRSKHKGFFGGAIVQDTKVKEYEERMKQRKKRKGKAGVELTGRAR